MGDDGGVDSDSVSDPAEGAEPIEPVDFTDAVPPASPSRMRRIIIIGLQLIVLAIMIRVFLGAKLGPIGADVQQFATLSNPWLILGLIMEIFSLLAYIRLTQVTLRGPACGYWRLLRIDMATLAVSHTVPAGSAASLGLGYRLLTKSGVPGSQAAVAKSLQAVGSAVVLNVILWFGLVGALIWHGNNPLYAPVAAAGAALMAACGFIVWAVIRGEQHAQRVMRRVIVAIRRGNPDSAARIVGELAAILRQLLGDRQLLWRICGWAAANWLLDAASLWCFVRGFGHTLGIFGLLVSYGLANVLAALPFTPSGLGVVEITAVGVLHSFSVPTQVATLGVLGWRLVNFWVPIPFGYAALLSLNRPYTPVTAAARTPVDDSASQAEATEPGSAASEPPNDGGS